MTVVERDRRFLPFLDVRTCQPMPHPSPHSTWPRPHRGACTSYTATCCRPTIHASLAPHQVHAAHVWTQAHIHATGLPLRIIGNLPFNIATPLFVQFMQHVSRRTGASVAVARRSHRAKAHFSSPAPS